MYTRNPAIIFIIIFINSLLYSMYNHMNNMDSDDNKYSIDLNLILKVGY